MWQLIRAARRSGQVMFRRNGHGHHAPVNPGPPATLDCMPVPTFAYKQVYGELQTKFNTFLAGSVAFFALTFVYACYEDVFIFDSYRAPKSYRDRK
uniref:Deltameth_res domain-containing protein n=1 Tax=Strongyloides venezuelensis TaxID=75913 RepID=A0A0K0G2P9_STRVS